MTCVTCSFTPLVVPSHTCSQVYSMLIAIFTDVITSSESAAVTAFKLDDLQKILSLTDSTRITSTSNDHKITRPGMVCSLARFMYLFARQRFIHFHGESNARLERHRSVYKDQADLRRTWLFTFLSPLLFFAPETYVSESRHIWVDGVFSRSLFESFLEKLASEWQQAILLVCASKYAFQCD